MCNLNIVIEALWIAIRNHSIFSKLYALFIFWAITYTLPKKKRIAGFIRLWLPYFKTTLSTEYGMYKDKIPRGVWNVSDVFINQDKSHVNQNISPTRWGWSQYLVWPTWAWITAVHRILIDCIIVYIRPCGILAHSSSNVYRSSLSVWGCSWRRRSRRQSSSQ